MRWIIWTAVVLVSIAGLVVAVGWLLPVKHEASRSARLNQPPERVYATVSDVGGYASWLEGVSRIEILDRGNGRIRFRQHTSDGAIVMEVVDSRPPDRFITAIADPDQPFGGTWTFDITAENGGSQLTITERGEVYNPIFRFMSRFVFGHTATMDNYLGSLEKRLSDRSRSP